MYTSKQDPSVATGAASLHPILSASRGLLDRIDELERIRMAYAQDIREETQVKSELEQELENTKIRYRQVDEGLRKSEEEKLIIQNKLLQAKSIKSKITEGMKVLLDTLERDQRTVKRMSLNDGTD